MILQIDGVQDAGNCFTCKLYGLNVTLILSSEITEAQLFYDVIYHIYIFAWYRRLGFGNISCFNGFQIGTPSTDA